MQPTPVTALIATTDGRYLLREITPDLDTLQQIVGGYIEAISPAAGDWHGYVDEEGKIDGAAMNVAATRLAHAAGWPPGDILFGDAVFLGNTDDGEEGDVPGEIITAAERLGEVQRG